MVQPCLSTARISHFIVLEYILDENKIKKHAKPILRTYHVGQQIWHMRRLVLLRWILAIASVRTSANNWGMYS